MKGDMICSGHLGGYVEGGDEATYYPALWDWLVRDFGVRSVVDVGCGDGVAVRYFRTLLTPEGCAYPRDVHGVDGIAQPPEKGVDIVQHDYTISSYEPGQFDLCWSCEFVEHVAERYMPNFLATFQCAPLVLMTHAMPDQQGWHHVNCNPPDYWRGVMGAIGYSLDNTLTRLTRELAAQNPSPWNHYKRSGLAFTRN